MLLRHSACRVGSAMCASDILGIFSSFRSGGSSSRPLIRGWCVRVLGLPCLFPAEISHILLLVAVASMAFPLLSSYYCWRWPPKVLPSHGIRFPMLFCIFRTIECAPLFIHWGIFFCFAHFFRKQNISLCYHVSSTLHSFTS